MKLCLVIKYPPIQGGTCTSGYWLAYGLAERGHQVYVVTNADEVEDEYRIHLSDGDGPWMEPTFEASGGFVKVFHTERFSPAKMDHIPKSNVYVTKLASQTAQVVREYDCDLIFSFYYEPYGVAGYLASQWTGRPLAMKHAGSDLERMLKNPTMATTYKEVLKATDGVLTRPNLAIRFMGMGVKPENIYAAGGGGLRTDVFNKEAEPLDLEALVNEKSWSPLGDHAPPFDPSVPTIGIYGKPGVFKGSYDLVLALSQLREQGVEVNFVALSDGRRAEDLKEFIKGKAIAPYTRLVPFIPNWKIPGFIRACTAVCFLERDFPIKIHTPQVATEILACGGCLILSNEIAQKQRYRDEIEDRKNLLLVKDPKEIDTLAAAIQFAVEDPKRAREIGDCGADLPINTGDPGAQVDFYERFFNRLIGRESDVAPIKTFVEKSSGTDFLPAFLDRLIPWLPAALGADRAEALKDDFLEIADISDDEHPIALARRYCRFLRAVSHGFEGEDHDFLQELLRFQETKLATSYDDPRDTVALFPVRDEIESPLDLKERVFGLRPMLNRSGRFESFEWNLAGLFKRGIQRSLGDAGDPTEAISKLRESTEKSPGYVLFFKTPNFLGGVVRVSDSTYDLLQLCDGSRTLEEVLAQVAEDSGFPADELRKPVTSTLIGLHQQIALIFSR